MINWLNVDRFVEGWKDQLGFAGVRAVLLSCALESERRDSACVASRRVALYRIIANLADRVVAEETPKRRRRAFDNGVNPRYDRGIDEKRHASAGSVPRSIDFFPYTAAGSLTFGGLSAARQISNWNRTVDACHISTKTIVTRWYGSRRNRVRK